MRETSYFVAEAPGGRLVGTWAADELRGRLATGTLAPTLVCLRTDATGDVRGQWRSLASALDPAPIAPAVPRPGRGLGRRVVLSVLAVSFVIVTGRPGELLDPPPSPPAPFTDLDTAIAADGFDANWVLNQPPPLPGLYRPHPTGPVQVIPRGSDRFVSLVARDRAGNLFEVDRIGSEPGFDLMVVPLQTEFGFDTYAVLKRERPAPERDAAEPRGAPDAGRENG